MRIERLELKNFRGTKHAVVDFDTTGITVLVGPNEIGKSSILEGFHLLIDLLDSSKHQRVVNVKPVDADEGPEVFARIRAGEYLFEFSKRWIKKPETTLKILEPKLDNYSSREAHEKVVEILDANLDRDLMGALQHELGDAKKSRPFTSKSLTTALDKAAGGDSPTATAEAETLWEKVEAEYQRYFTKSRKPNAERTGRADQVRELEARIDGLAARINDLVEEGELFDRLTIDEASERVNCDELTQRLAELELEWKGIEGVVGEKQSAESAFAAAEARANQSAAALESRERLKTDVETKSANLKDLESAFSKTKHDGSDLIERRDAALRDVTVAEEKLEAAEASVETASQDLEHLRRVLDVEMLRERSERLTGSRTRQKELSVELETLSIDDDVLEQIVAAHNEKTEFDARLQSAAFRVRVEALGPVKVVFGDEKLELSKGETQELTGSDGIKLTVDDKLTVSVAGTEEQAAVAADASRASQKLAKLLDKHNVPQDEGLAGAQAVNRRRSEVLTEQRAVDDSIQNDLRDLGPDDIDDKIERNQSEIDAYLKSRASDPKLPEDLDDGKVAQASAIEALTTAKKDAEKARIGRDAAIEAASAHETNLSVLDARVTDAKTQTDQATAALESVRSGESDESLEKAKADAEKELKTAEVSLKSVESKLSELNSEGVKAQLDATRASAEGARERVSDLGIKLESSRTKLEVRGREGLKSEIDELGAELDHERRRLISLERRASAAELLYTRMGGRRDAANRNYVAPFSNQIDGLGRIVFGHDAEFEIDPGTLEIKSLARDGKRIPFDSLSTGTKEQCQLLASLATAQLTSADGSGAPVVLDDALGSTDPERIERIGAVLASAAKDCQIIILTCDSARYRSVGAPSIVSVGIDTREESEEAATAPAFPDSASVKTDSFHGA